MAFTYQFGANPGIDFPRMLIGDTQDTDHIFEDSEIQSAYVIQAAQFQSSMLYSGGAGQNLPSSPVSYLRVAALLLDALASSKARLIVSKLLDATITPAQTAKALHDQAQAWREVEDNSGAFCIIEQCTTSFNFLSRFYAQVQRQNAQ